MADLTWTEDSPRGQHAALAARLLEHYLRTLWEEAGLAWDTWDNSAEVRGIVNSLLLAADAPRLAPEPWENAPIEWPGPDDAQAVADAVNCLCVTDCGEGDACDTAATASASSSEPSFFAHGNHTLDGDCTACSHAGKHDHSHDDDPCPVHPERVVG